MMVSTTGTFDQQLAAKISQYETAISNKLSAAQAAAVALEKLEREQEELRTQSLQAATRYAESVAKVKAMQIMLSQMEADIRTANVILKELRQVTR